MKERSLENILLAILYEINCNISHMKRNYLRATMVTLKELRNCNRKLLLCQPQK